MTDPAAAVPALDADAVRRAVDTALEPYGDADQLLQTLLRKQAADVDTAESPSARAAAVRLLLELADRLDLVPLAPGRAGRGEIPPAPPAATEGDDGAGNVFDVPDEPPAPPG